MKFSKLCAFLDLNFKEALEEQEYREIKVPLVRSFFQLICCILSLLMIPYSIRYFNKGIYFQAFSAIGLIIISIIVCFIRKKLEKYMECLLLFYLGFVIALGLSVFQALLSNVESVEAFYMGYNFALIQRLLGYSITKYKFMILLHLASIICKFIIIGTTEPFLTVIVVMLESVTVLLSFKHEKAERKLFDSLYKAKKDTLKFKHLITEYFPNQMAIFSTDFSTTKYINKSFKRAFRCENLPQAKGVLENLIIESDTIEKKKVLFNKLGYSGLSSGQSMTLSGFIKLFSRDIVGAQKIGDLNLQVTEAEHNYQPERVQNLEESSIQKDLKQTPRHAGLRDSLRKLLFKKEIFCENSPRNRESPQNSLPNTYRDLLKTEKAVNSSFEGSNQKPRTSSVSEIGSEEGIKRTFKAKIFFIVWEDSDAIVLILDDVTKQLTISELKTADKNKDYVIAMISHELRTPLNGMLGMIDIVDDNPFNLMVASHLMEEKDYKIKTALNGKDAIQKVVLQEESGRSFKLILMDCQMPVMDGYEATRILRKMMKNKEVSECPILAVTANTLDEEHEKLCQEVGMSGCVAKPLKLQDFDQMFKKIQGKEVRKAK